MTINTLTFLQSLGVFCGIVGALFVAGSSRHSRSLGFWMWTLGNAAWVLAAVQLENPYLFVQFGIFFFTAVLGLRNNRPGQVVRNG